MSRKTLEDGTVLLGFGLDTKESLRCRKLDDMRKKPAASEDNKEIQKSSRCTPEDAPAPTAKPQHQIRLVGWRKKNHEGLTQCMAEIAERNAADGSFELEEQPIYWSLDDMRHRVETDSDLDRLEAQMQLREGRIFCFCATRLLIATEDCRCALQKDI